MSFSSMVLALAALQASDPGSFHIKSALTAYQAGNTAAHQSNYREAIGQFKKAIEIEPTFQDAFEALIAACLRAGQQSDAATAATQLLEIEPEFTRYRLLLGQILSEEGQTERALAQFSLVLKSDKLNAEALIGFARVAKQLGMEDRAADALKKGRQQYPRDSRFK